MQRSWSISWSKGSLIGVVTLAVLLAGCGGSEKAARRERAFRIQLRLAYDRYQKYEPQKAMALAHDEGGIWALGFSREYESRDGAIQRAMTECRRERERYQVSASCELFAVGEKVTGNRELLVGR